MRIYSYSQSDSESVCSSQGAPGSRAPTPETTHTSGRAPGTVEDNSGADTKIDDNLPPYQENRNDHTTSRGPNSTSSGASSATMSDSDIYDLPARPTNFFRLHEMNAKICDTFVIDPSMDAKGGTPRGKPNLDLHTMNGIMAVKVHLLGPRKNSTPKKAHLVLGTNNGAITTCVDFVNREVPFDLDVNTNNASVKVYLPRSFKGKINISSSNGRTDLAFALNAKATSSGRGRYRIGTRNESDNEVVIRTLNGSIYVGYVDECREDFRGRRRETRPRTRTTSFPAPNVHSFFNFGGLGSFFGFGNANVNIHTTNDEYETKSSYSESYASSDAGFDTPPSTPPPRIRTPNMHNYINPNLNADIRNYVHDAVRNNAYNANYYDIHGHPIRNAANVNGRNYNHFSGGSVHINHHNVR